MRWNHACVCPQSRGPTLDRINQSGNVSLAGTLARRLFPLRITLKQANCKPEPLANEAATLDFPPETAQPGVLNVLIHMSYNVLIHVAVLIQAASPFWDDCGCLVFACGLASERGLQHFGMCSCLVFACGLASERGRLNTLG